MYLDPRYPEHADLITRENLARYLLHHPDAALRLITGGADDYLAFRVDYLGNYGEFSNNPPGSQECRLCLLPTVSRAFAWSGLAGVATYWLVCLIGAGTLICRSTRGTIRRGFAVIAVMLIGVTIAQYLTAVLGGGNEITKHLSVALLAASLTPVWLAASVFTPGRGRRRAALQLAPAGNVPPAGSSRSIRVVRQAQVNGRIPPGCTVPFTGGM